MKEIASTATEDVTTTSVRLTRTQNTWTGAGSAAGYVLRYLIPVRKLMIEMAGDAADADRAIVILISHLVKSGFAEHGHGRLRDFLVKGVRSSLKALVDQSGGQRNVQAKDVDWQLAGPENPTWLQLWRESLMQRAWRSLERRQYAARRVLLEDADELAIYDCLYVAMAHPGESAEVLAGRVAKSSGGTCTASQLKQQVSLGRLRFAQLLADEVAQSLDPMNATAVRDEIKRLDLQKAFSGLRVRA
ncbi:MAG: hypothetical protein AAGD07_02075 [Planctomycetota bacterium]